jgi:carbamoyl-phosphate synthase large subunit
LSADANSCVAVLALEDGRSFVGRALGARGVGQGEVVFNTAMTGYQEMLTDPSYAGQLLCATYPQQGNYGTRSADAESRRAWVRGFVACSASRRPSHHSSTASLDAFLRAQGVPGITDIDTRALTCHLRSSGALRAVLCHEPQAPSATRLRRLHELAMRVTPLSDQDLVAQVSRRVAEEWLEPLPLELRWRGYANGDGLTIVVVDCGVKSNILRSLRQRGCRVLVLPHTATWDDVRAAGADGLLLPNGPGDPASLEGQVELCRRAIGRIPLIGICLGHQILGRAAGATTSRLPFGHHGANHPVKDLCSGAVHITSQNHEFQVDAETLPDSDFYISQVNLNDGSVEGLAHRSLPVFSVQYHPEGCPGPTDNQHVFDRFIDIARARRPPLTAPGAAATSRPRPRRVLIIGSGPIVIGQAAEFDYAGTQACKALREEGVETVLVNPNPATIMTDEDVADRVYIEPLTVEAIEKILERERPDAVLPTLGGQTGLNLAMELYQAGVLARHGVRFLGADADVIRRAEDRAAFKELLVEIGEPVPPSRVCRSLEAAREFAAEIGLPLVVRPAYTLGGTGGGFVTTPEELDRVVRRGLAASPIGQVLVERSLWGWKEIEYEVMRDAASTCITVCNMENLDPMGVHTGDSIVVAPAQTLSDRDHQMLRSSALRIIRALGVEGGCNVQFALDPASSAYYVIEVNPRVSRSSALASKATGYPIARVAAKVAVGLRLDEIRNEVTGCTFAAFEPALDYVVVKVPRWPFDKFPDADRTLGTQMKSTGEVMAIGRTFEDALAKALRSLEQRPPGEAELDDPALIEVPNDRRLFALIRALEQGASVAGLVRRSGIDAWFLDGIEAMLRMPADSRPLAFKGVDTCAAEFEARTPYFYSCQQEETEVPGQTGRSALVVGSGPIRIGQGIEFDYCSVHGARALRAAGLHAIMVNSNPETVSTDFDSSDRLYFEPLDDSSVEAIARTEGVHAVVAQFGGQTAIDVAGALAANGIRILGSSVEAMDLAEDRRRFSAAMNAIAVPQPAGGTATCVEEALAIVGRIGFPVLVRPSYVLGGRAMEIVHDARELRRYMEWALSALPRGEVLVDRYLPGIEVEVDAVSDGMTVVVVGIMRHVERAGVHSGDSCAVYPARGLGQSVEERIVSCTVRIARHLRLVGLVNVQYVVHDGGVHVLEVNPRASRTVPMLSKVTGVPMVPLATRAMLGERLADLGWESGLVAAPPLFAVKAPVFSMSKMAGVDPHLGPEMRSTGEVMGVDRTLPAALRKALSSAGTCIRPGGRALLTVADADKPELLTIASRLAQLGYRMFATSGTAAALRRAGLTAELVARIGEPGPPAMDLVAGGRLDLVISTASGSTVRPDRPAGTHMRDGWEIRVAATAMGVPCLTSLDTAAAVVESAWRADGELEVRTITEWREGLASTQRLRRGAETAGRPA